MAAEDGNLNRQPVTDEPGAHPVGAGIGATGGAGTRVGVAGGSLMGMSDRRRARSGTERPSGGGAMVGEVQSAGDRDDVIDVLNDLIETCKDGEYGFKACAEYTKRSDLKSLFLQRADDCRGGAQELQRQVRSLGGKMEEGRFAMGAVERGWVAVRGTLSAYDDKAMLEECERREDEALARYRTALKKPLPASIKPAVERQLQGVQRNHDRIKMLRGQFSAST